MSLETGFKTIVGIWVFFSTATVLRSTGGIHTLYVPRLNHDCVKNTHDTTY